MGFGSFAGGLAKGLQAGDEMLSAEAKREMLKAEADERREKLASQRELNKVLANGLPGFKSDTPKAAPASAPIEPMLNFGGNLTEDPAFAKSMADAENFASGADEPGSDAAVVAPTSAYRVEGVGVYGDPKDAIDASQAAAELPAAKAPTAIDDAYGAYRKQVVPKAVAAFIKAGKLPEARAYLEFVRGEEGEAYARDWLSASQAVDAGDFEGAIPALGNLYNRSVPNGRRAEWESIGDGRYRVSHFDEATGAKVGEREMTAPDLARMGLDSLSPAKRVEAVLASQKEQRQETRKLLQQTAMEDRRDDRAAARDDARDERLQKSIAAAAERQTRALDSRGGLTAPQERSNAEIDAARERVASLDPAEVKRRSQKATNTGRENPDYDPSIARSAALAARRKIGEDDWFDGLQGQKPEAAKAEPVQSRFASDPAMKGYRMGRRTPGGHEVFDASGQLIGHFQ
jgi:hypothetical protein